MYLSSTEPNVVTLNETTDGLSLDEIKNSKDVQGNLELRWIAIAVTGWSLNGDLYFILYSYVYLL